VFDRQFVATAWNAVAYGLVCLSRADIFPDAGVSERSKSSVVEPSGLLDIRDAK
jgi:hypothetical protein